MLHLETIEPKTLELLRRLQSLPIFEHSRLVGGTALALQLGHRKSIYLDMFGIIDSSPERNTCSWHAVKRNCNLVSIEPSVGLSSGLGCPVLS